MAERHRWGRASSERILTLVPEWWRILDEVLAASPFDLTVVWGYRGQEAQDLAHAMGTSTKAWPESVHNAFPSRAVDLAPYIDGRIDWGRQDHGRRYYIVAGLVFAAAAAAGCTVRWGGDWDRDGDLDDQTLQDLGHFELILTTTT